MKFLVSLMSLALVSQASLASVATYTCKASQLEPGAILTVVDDSSQAKATMSVAAISQPAAKVVLDMAASAQQMPQICEIAKVDCAKVASATMYSTVINGFLIVGLIEMFDANQVNIGQVYVGNTLPMACDK